MAADSNLRDTMNQGELQRLADIDRDTFMGEVVNAFINGMTATEAGVVVTTNLSAPLAATPLVLWDANATAAASTGKKKINKVSAAYLTANNPPVGECFWNGATGVKFNSADAVTAASYKYPKAADATCSFLQRKLAQSDPA